MHLTGLAELIGPPPAEPFSIDWPGIERTLGLALPDDYKAFGDAYGPCRIGEILAITVLERPRRLHELLQHDRTRG
jgi:hypothetical protein